MTRTSAPYSDPATAVEASRTIRALALDLGWGKPKSNSRAYIYSRENAESCLICADTFQRYQLVRLTCGHYHCQDCLRQNYQVVLNDHAAYPPRCCQDLLLAQTGFVLSDAEAKVIFTLRQAHQASKIVPCFSCEGDIYLGNVGIDSAYCGKCKKATCTTCMKEMHLDLCPEDPDTTALRDLAKQEGWSQCPKCGRVIHKVAGCSSMTCLQCAALLAAARRHPPPVPPPPPPVQPGPVAPARINHINNFRHRAEITFGSALQASSSPRYAKTYKEKAGDKLFRQYEKVLANTMEENNMKVKDIRAQRSRRAREIKMATEVTRLRLKMKELVEAEKAQKREIRLQKSDGPRDRPARRLVTRRNIYEVHGSRIATQPNEGPVAKRTRSQNKTAMPS
ncbi:hypothetical protein DRE_02773 [Drechslerella stenobrocha 248]|uniref:RING-type domain-containing protein n=1 Tax=Drechslerella stenobrocha 248 TaxID=1043628 RepID=W7HUK8_9PEZI|nr:hypothetical protein DRE_02773 [Drechslerella stenobrocha 248]